MDLAQCFLEVEVFVYFFWGDADIPARREAPVIGFDLVPIHQFDQAFNIGELRFREAFSQPIGLSPEVADLLELLDGQLAGFIGGLAGAGDVAVSPGIAFAGFAFVLAGFDDTTG